MEKRITLPKKVEGVETSYNGFHLTCKSTGEEFDGIPTLAWYHDSGSKAFRSVNGNITFIEPEDMGNSDVMSGITEQIIHKYAEAISEEDQLFKVAWNIASKRYPEMNRTRDTFGQIVNSIGTRLIAIKQMEK